MENDSLQLVEGGEKLADKRVYTILPYKEDQILIGTRSSGLFIYHAAKDRAKHLPRFTPFNSEANDFLIQKKI